MKLHLTYEFETEDELRTHLGGETRSHTITATEVVRAPAVTSEPEPEVVETRDADGMEWNPEYHSTPKSFTEDGNWRAKRGAAEAAKAARAAFKAQGGAVAAAAPAMPAMPTAPVAPAMPVMAPPVSFERVVAKITGMMQRGKLDMSAISGLYAKVGATDNRQFETNESLRAALFAELSAIEPEVA